MIGNSIYPWVSISMHKVLQYKITKKLIDVYKTLCKTKQFWDMSPLEIETHKNCMHSLPLAPSAHMPDKNFSLHKINNDMLKFYLYVDISKAWKFIILWSKFTC